MDEQKLMFCTPYIEKTNLTYFKSALSIVPSVTVESLKYNF